MGNLLVTRLIREVKLCIKCKVIPLISSTGKPYTKLDDVNGDGICQWCRK